MRRLDVCFAHPFPILRQIQLSSLAFLIAGSFFPVNVFQVLVYIPELGCFIEGLHLVSDAGMSCIELEHFMCVVRCRLEFLLTELPVLSSLLKDRVVAQLLCSIC